MDWHARIREAFGETTPDEGVVEELAQHASAVYESTLADGMSGDEAHERVEALISAWSVDSSLKNRRLQSRLPDSVVSSATPLAGLAHDVRYGARLVRREPFLPVLMVLLIALGVGSTATLFSVTYGVLLKPFPWPEPDRLIRLEERHGGRTAPVPWLIGNGTYLAWEDEPQTIEAIGAWGPVQRTLKLAGEPTRVSMAAVTPSLFSVLGARPLLGRLFVPEDVRSRATVCVLSFGLWRDRFGADAELVGHSVDIDGVPTTVVGVLPRDFVFPDREAMAWTPLTVVGVMSSEVGPGGRTSPVTRLMLMAAMARLRPGFSPEQAAAEATARGMAAPDAGRALTALFGSRGELTIQAAPAREVATAEVRPVIVLLMAAGCLLFAATVASVITVQLARAAARRREIAVRAALGAGVGRIARQWIVEAAMLAAAGGILAVAVVVAAQRALPSVLPADFPRVADIVLDWHVIVFAVVAAALAATVAGVTPALGAARLDLTGALAEDAAAPVGAGLRTPTGRARVLVMAGEIAVATVLLVGASLLARSFLALLGADRGYDPRNLITLTTPLPRRSSFQSDGPTFERIEERVESIPGVTAVGFGNALPFVDSGGYRTQFIPSPGAGRQPGDVQTIHRIVSPGYFAAMGLRLIAGRELADTDVATSTPVVVVNRSFARQYLGTAAVGSDLGPINGVAPWQVAGVVDDMRQGGLSGQPADPFGGVAAAPQPELFQSYRQTTGTVTEIALVVRTSGDPVPLMPIVRSIVRAEAPNLAIGSMMTMDDRVVASLAKPRVYAIVFAAFAALALAIAGCGLFGVLSYTTSRRTREIGVRKALGAETSDVVALVVRQGMAIAGLGLAAGLGAAYVLARLLASALFGVTVHDPASFLAGPVVLLIVAVVACALPAKRAARVDPVEALRGH